jgi:hypothetical protein
MPFYEEWSSLSTTRFSKSRWNDAAYCITLYNSTRQTHKQNQHTGSTQTIARVACVERNGWSSTETHVQYSGEKDMGVDTIEYTIAYESKVRIWNGSTATYSSISTLYNELLKRTVDGFISFRQKEGELSIAQVMKEAIHIHL